MKGHPAYKRREPLSIGAAILAATSGDGFALLDAPNVEPLGTRSREVKSSDGSETLRYTLDGFVILDPTDGGKTRERIYVLAGGRGSRRTVLNRNGEPVSHQQTKGNGRGLSPEFREWIASAVAADSAFVRDDSGSAAIGALLRLSLFGAGAAAVSDACARGVTFSDAGWTVAAVAALLVSAAGAMFRSEG